MWLLIYYLHVIVVAFSNGYRWMQYKQPSHRAIIGRTSKQPPSKIGFFDNLLHKNRHILNSLEKEKKTRFNLTHLLFCQRVWSRLVPRGGTTLTHCAAAPVANVAQLVPKVTMPHRSIGKKQGAYCMQNNEQTPRNHPIRERLLHTSIRVPWHCFVAATTFRTVAIVW